MGPGRYAVVDAGQDRAEADGPSWLSNGLLEHDEHDEQLELSSAEPRDPEDCVRCWHKQERMNKRLGILIFKLRPQLDR